MRSIITRIITSKTRITATTDTIMTTVDEAAGTAMKTKSKRLIGYKFEVAFC